MTKKVLFVCRDQEMLRTHEKGLKKYTKVFSLIIADNEVVAKEILKTTTISLVAADLGKPQEDGHAFLSHLIENYPDIHLVLLADENSPENEKHALKTGTAGYINKPFATEDLVKKIIGTLRNEVEGGILHGTAPGTFLQLVEMEQKTCTIRLNDEQSGDQGVLFFLEGELLDARLKSLRGRDAAYSILAWNEATLAIQESCLVQENKVQADLQALLLEAMRLKDEKEQAREDKMTQEEIDEYIISKQENVEKNLENKMTQEEIDEYIISKQENVENPEFTIELEDSQDLPEKEQPVSAGPVESKKALKKKIPSKNIAPVSSAGDAAVSYTTIDNILGVLSDFKESFLESAFIKHAFRLLALFAVVIFVGIIFLFMTLETDKDLIRQIDQAKASIRLQQEALLDLDKKIEGLYISKENSIRSNDSQVEIMDLDLKIAELEEKQDKMQTESTVQQRAMEEWQTKIEAMKRKSLFERLMEHSKAYLSPNS